MFVILILCECFALHGAFVYSLRWLLRVYKRLGVTRRRYSEPSQAILKDVLKVRPTFISVGIDGFFFLIGTTQVTAQLKRLQISLAYFTSQVSPVSKEVR